MNVEGIGRILSPEWLRATLTAIPVLLAAYWIVVAQSALWRRAIWRTLGPDLRALERTSGGTLRARWGGFEWAAPDGRRVRWWGGLRGPRTRVRGPRPLTADRWLTAAELDPPPPADGLAQGAAAPPDEPGRS